MPIEILMPALSPTMTEGNLVRWLKKEGDVVKAGELLAEIETDKATMEMEAVDEGVMGTIIVPGGTEGVKVNELIAVLLEEGEAMKDFKPKGPSPKKDAAPQAAALETQATVQQPVATATTDRLFASPLARRVAQETHIDLTKVKGTGPRGRIVEADIRQAGQKASMPVASLPGETPYREISLNNMRKIIAKRLTEAKQQVPHFYLTIDCHLDALLRLRGEVNVRLSEDKLSVNDFIIRACALALIEVPEANAAWHDTVIRQYQNADVAVAVAIEGGLVTPLIRHVETKSLRELSVEMRVLAQRARAGKLMPEEYQGGTFTLSNLGMYGIKHFGAILNPPQACILAVGMGEKRPVVTKDGSVGVATVMTCTLSVDHRAVDGAVGSRFLAAFKVLMEDPLRLLL
jgi:pyruvate dehydrogenase E2 component (dihydrolipoamide acetyltransferase)